MASVIQLKRSETSGSTPTASQIAVGELAVNLADGTLYSKKTDGSIIEVGGSSSVDYFVMPATMDMGNLSGTNPDTYDMGSL